MRNFFWIIILLLTVAACRETTTPESKETMQATPQEREHPNPKPVAVYSEKVTGETGELNNWKFEVALYETAKTFTYRLQVKYAELDITDSLQLPDFDRMPKPALQKGKQNYSCVIGFLDDKNTFRDYKLVSVTDGNLHITTLKYYSIKR